MTFKCKDFFFFKHNWLSKTPTLVNYLGKAAVMAWIFYGDLPGAMISNSLTFHFSTPSMLIHSSNQKLFYIIKYVAEGSMAQKSKPIAFFSRCRYRLSERETLDEKQINISLYQFILRVLLSCWFVIISFIYFFLILLYICVFWFFFTSEEI